MSKTRRPPGGQSEPEKTNRGGGTRIAGRSRACDSGGLQGGARYGLLNIPEPVAAADADFDRGDIAA